MKGKALKGINYKRIIYDFKKWKKIEKNNAYSLVID